MERLSFMALRHRAVPKATSYSADLCRLSSLRASPEPRAATAPMAVAERT